MADGCPVHRVTASGDVIDAYRDHVAASKFAVDGQIEESKMAFLALLNRLPQCSYLHEAYLTCFKYTQNMSAIASA